MALEPTKPTPETITRQTYQTPRLERHGDYKLTVGRSTCIGCTALQNPGEFWDNSKFWDDLERPSF